MWERPIFELKYYSFFKKKSWLPRNKPNNVFNSTLCINFEKYAEIVSIFLFLAIYFL